MSNDKNTPQDLPQWTKMLIEGFILRERELESKIEALIVENANLKRDVRNMVNKAYDNHFDGYRELGNKACLAEERADGWRLKCKILRDVCQRLVEFQVHYNENCFDSMPGNKYYGSLLMEIVVAAKAAIVETEVSTCKKSQQS